jgi:MFS family permease
MRYWVLGLICVIAVIAYVQRTAISVPVQLLKSELGMDNEQMGWVLSGWYLGYAALQIPCGWLADRWGSRRSLVSYAVIWSVLTGVSALATDFATLLVLWCTMGLAQAGLVPAAAKAIGDWIPETRRAFASGLFACSMVGGAALAPYLTSQLLAVLSWQQVFVLYAVPGIAWGLVFLLLTPEAATRVRARAVRSVDWSRFLSSVPMALLCLQQFLRAAAMVFFYTWFPTYLQDARGVSLSEAGNLAAWPSLGALVGGLSGGWASDWLLARTGSLRVSRQGTAVAGMTCCAVLTIVAYFIEDTHAAMLLLSIGAFAGTFGGVSGYSVTIAFGGRHVGTVFSVMNMSGNIGAFLFPLGVGWFVQHYQRWDLVLFFFAGCFAIDAVCWALLNPEGTLFEEDHEPRNDAAEPLPSRAGAD